MHVRFAKHVVVESLSIRELYDVILSAHATLTYRASRAYHSTPSSKCSPSLLLVVYEAVVLEQHEPTHSLHSARPSPRRQLSVSSLPVGSWILAHHYSSFTQQKASRYGLTGWVRNTSSGKVGMNIAGRWKIH